jgi:hypothetical protein
MPCRTLARGPPQPSTPDHTTTHAPLALPAPPGQADVRDGAPLAEERGQAVVRGCRCREALCIHGAVVIRIRRRVHVRHPPACRGAVGRQRQQRRREHRRRQRRHADARHGRHARERRHRRQRHVAAVGGQELAQVGVLVQVGVAQQELQARRERGRRVDRRRRRRTQRARATLRPRRQHERHGGGSGAPAGRSALGQHALAQRPAGRRPCAAFPAALAPTNRCPSECRLCASLYARAPNIGEPLAY